MCGFRHAAAAWRNACSTPASPGGAPSPGGVRGVLPMLAMPLSTSQKSCTTSGSSSRGGAARRRGAGARGAPQR